MDNEPQNSPEEKEKNRFWIALDWISKTNGRIAVIVSILVLFSWLTFWVTKGKEPEIIGQVTDSVMEYKECQHDDIITGEIRVNGKIKRAAICSLTVYNRYQKDVKPTIANENTKGDGTFKFSFCKATTYYVEFIVNDYQHEPYTRGYPVDSIPSIVNFQ